MKTLLRSGVANAKAVKAYSKGEVIDTLNGLLFGIAFFFGMMVSFFGAPVVILMLQGHELENMAFFKILVSLVPSTFLFIMLSIAMTKIQVRYKNTVLRRHTAKSME